MATLEATDIYLNAIDNLSNYESRYDKFAFTLGALDKGQYRYEVIENPATYPRVIETGLAMIETTEGSFTSTTNTIDYVSYD